MKRFLRHLASWLPSKLPVGATEFDQWAIDIIDLAGQFADMDSMKFAIASILIHADARHGALPKKYFVDRLRKSAANQIASQVFQDIKLKQQQELEKQKAEATAKLQQAGASNVEQSELPKA